MKLVCLPILALCAVLAACQSRTAPQPPAQPPSPPVPPPQTATGVAPPSGSFEDWPLASGDWMYREDVRGSVAMFGEGGQDAKLVVRCDQPDRRIYVSVPGRVTAGGGALTLSTFTGTRRMPLANTGGVPPYAAAAFEPSDRFLDAMVHSRGRFGLEAPGLARTAFPNWSEFARVIENCRGAAPG